MNDAVGGTNADLTKGPVAKGLFFFMLPILFGNVLQSLNGSVNAIWVGHYLGEAALTATANANMIMFFLIGCVFGIGMAAAILVARHVGAGDIAGAKRVVGTSLVFFVALSLLVAVLGFIFARTLLGWMHTPHDAMALAVAYLHLIFVAIPFQFAYIFLMMILRGTGDTKTPFLFLWLSVGLDIALNPLFIFGWGPLHGLGIAGSALASLVAQSVSLVALLWYLQRSRYFLFLGRNELACLWPDLAIVKNLAFKGFPMGLQMIVASLSMIVMIAMVNSFGSATGAAYGACLQLWNYVQMPAMAVGMAVSNMIALNIGAGLHRRVRRIAVTGITFNFVMTGGLVALIYVFNHRVLGLFLPDHAPALPVAEHINALVAWSYIMFGVTFVLSGVMRASGAVMAPLIILVISFWGARLLFARLFIASWGADAVWWSLDVGAASSMLLSLAYYRWGKMARRAQAPEMPAPLVS